MQAVSSKLFDSLLQEQKDWADAESTTATVFNEEPPQMEAEK